MKNLFFPLALVLVFILHSWIALGQFRYISPLPGSKFHNPETNIILKNGDYINEPSLRAKGLFSISGSITGKHEADVILSDDRRTVVLEPVMPFSEGETVTVTVNQGMKNTEDKNIEGVSFEFYIREKRTQEVQARLDNARRKIFEDEFGKITSTKGDNTIRDISDWQGGLPPFQIMVNNNPAPGDIFFHNFNFGGYPTDHYCIISNDGDSIYGKYNLISGLNFNLNHNNYLTMFNFPSFKHEMMDSNYNIMATFSARNGYDADVHEFQIFLDGHSYLMAYDPQPVDMTVYDSTYNPDATVIGLIIQELDAAKHLVFQWRSWDYFDIFDATFLSFASDEIDYVHGNSIELDHDGNLIISCRHMDEITKIDHNTGDIIWRLGGKNNQFTFINDPNMFSHQHDVRRIDNGNLTVFDNGNFHLPPRSAAKEYALDEVNKTATLVWSYSPSMNGNGVALGSVQRLSNGNTFICWGLVYNPLYPTITEVDPVGNVVWQMKLDNEFNDGIYRAHKFDWTPCSRPTASSLKSSNVTKSAALLKWSTATNASAYEVQYKKSSASSWITVPTVNTTLSLKSLTAGTQYNWRVRSACNLSVPTYSGYTPKKSFTTSPPRLLALEELAELTVFPNPCTDVVHVRIDDVETNSVLLRLSNTLGQKIMSEEVVNTSEIDIPVKHLPAGMYILEVMNGDNVLAEQILVE